MIQIICKNHDSQRKGKVLLGKFNGTVIQMDKNGGGEAVAERLVSYLENRNEIENSFIIIAGVLCVSYRSQISWKLPLPFCRGQHLLLWFMCWLQPPLICCSIT